MNSQYGVILSANLKGFEQLETAGRKLEQLYGRIGTAAEKFDAKMSDRFAGLMAEAGRLETMLDGLAARVGEGAPRARRGGQAPRAPDAPAREPAREPAPRPEVTRTPLPPKGFAQQGPKNIQEARFHYLGEESRRFQKDITELDKSIRSLAKADFVDPRLRKDLERTLLDSAKRDPSMAALQYKVLRDMLPTMQGSRAQEAVLTHKDYGKNPAAAAANLVRHIDDRVTRVIDGVLLQAVSTRTPIRGERMMPILDDIVQRAAHFDDADPYNRKRGLTRKMRRSKGGRTVTFNVTPPVPALFGAGLSGRHKGPGYNQPFPDPEPSPDLLNEAIYARAHKTIRENIPSIYGFRHASGVPKDPSADSKMTTRTKEQIVINEFVRMLGEGGFAAPASMARDAGLPTPNQLLFPKRTSKLLRSNKELEDQVFEESRKGEPLSPDEVDERVAKKIRARDKLLGRIARGDALLEGLGDALELTTGYTYDQDEIRKALSRRNRGSQIGTSGVARAGGMNALLEQMVSGGLQIGSDANLQQWLSTSLQQDLHRIIKLLERQLLQEGRGGQLGADILPGSDYLDSLYAPIEGRVRGATLSDFDEDNGRSPSGRFRDRFRTVGLYAASAGVIYGGGQFARESFSQMAEFEERMIAIRQVINPLRADMAALSGTAFEVARDLGANVNDVAAGQVIYAQQGLSGGQINQQVGTAALAQNVTDLDLEESTEGLTAAQKQFKLALADSARVLDAWNEIENTSAVRASVLADATKRAGTAARSAGVDFDQFNGIVAAMSEATRKSGREVGTSLKFMFQHLRDPEAVASLQQLGIFTQNAEGTFRSASDVIGELAGRWEDLTNAEQRNVAQAIAGSRHYNDFVVMIETWGRAGDLASSSLLSQGSALRENEIAMESLRKKMAQFRASWDALVTSLGNSGTLDFLKALTDQLTLVTDGFGGLTRSLSGGGDIGGNPLGALIGGAGLVGVGLSSFGYLGGELFDGLAFGSRRIGASRAGASTEDPAPRGGRGVIDGLAAASLGPEDRTVGRAGGAARTRRRGFFTGRGAPLTALVAGTVARGIYANYVGRDPFGRPDLSDTAVDVAGAGIQGYGIYGLLKGSDPLFRGEGALLGKGSGLGGKARGIFALASLASAGFSAYQSASRYIGGQNPTSAVGFNAEEGEIQAYLRSVAGAGSALRDITRGGGLRDESDTGAVQDVKYAIAALVPELTRVEDGVLRVMGNTDSWRSSLEDLEVELRRRSAGNITANLEALLGGDEVTDLLQKRASAAEKLQQAGDDLLLRQQAVDEIAAVETELGRLTERVRGLAQVSARANLGVGGVLDAADAVSERVGRDQEESERFRRERLDEFLRARLGYSVESSELLQRGGFGGTSEIQNLQFAHNGRIFDRLGNMVAEAGEAAANFARSNRVFRAYDATGVQAVAVTPDTSLEAVADRVAEAVGRLTDKNDRLIASIDQAADIRRGRYFGLDPTSAGGLEDLVRRIEARADQNTLGGDIVPGARQLRGLSYDQRARLLTDTAELAGFREGGLGLRGRTRAGLALAGLRGEPNQLLEKLVDKLIAANAEGNDEQISALNQRLLELFNNDERTVSEIGDRARDIARRRPDATEQQIELLTKNLLEVSRGRLADQNTSAVRDILAPLSSAAEAFAADSVAAAELLLRRFDARGGSAETFAGSREARGVLEPLGRSRDAFRDIRAELEEAIGVYGENSDAGRQAAEALRSLEAALEPANAVLDDTTGLLRQLGEGARSIGSFVARAQEAAGSGGLFGLGGGGADRFALQQLNNRTADLRGRLETAGPVEAAQLEAAISQLTAAAHEVEQGAARRRQQEQLTAAGLGQSVLAAQYRDLLGGDGDGSAAMREVFRVQLDALAGEAARRVGEAGPGERAGLREEFRGLFGELSGLVRGVGEDPGYRRNYLLASDSQRAAADQVRGLLESGLSPEEVFADPSMRYAARGNPLLGQILEGALQGDRDQKLVELFTENSRQNDRLVQLVSEITNKIGPGAPDVTTSAPRISSMAGTLAQGNHPATTGDGRIARDGTPAVLHRGEIVLNKEQSDAFLRNSFASGTLPRKWQDDLGRSPGLSRTVLNSWNRLPGFLQNVLHDETPQLRGSWYLRPPGTHYAGAYYDGSPSRIHLPRDSKNPNILAHELGHYFDFKYHRMHGRLRSGTPTRPPLPRYPAGFAIDHEIDLKILRGQPLYGAMQDIGGPGSSYVEGYLLTPEERVADTYAARMGLRPTIEGNLLEGRFLQTREWRKDFSSSLPQYYQARENARSYIRDKFRHNPHRQMFRAADRLVGQQLRFFKKEFGADDLSAEQVAALQTRARGLLHRHSPHFTRQKAGLEDVKAMAGDLVDLARKRNYLGIGPKSLERLLFAGGKLGTADLTGRFASYSPSDDFIGIGSVLRAPGMEAGEGLGTPAQARRAGASALFHELTHRLFNPFSVDLSAGGLYPQFKQHLGRSQSLLLGALAQIDPGLLRDTATLLNAGGGYRGLMGSKDVGNRLTLLSEALAHANEKALQDGRPPELLRDVNRLMAKVTKKHYQILDGGDGYGGAKYQVRMSRTLKAFNRQMKGLGVEGLNLYAAGDLERLLNPASALGPDARPAPIPPHVRPGAQAPRQGPRVPDDLLRAIGVEGTGGLAGGVDELRGRSLLTEPVQGVFGLDRLDSDPAALWPILMEQEADRLAPLIGGADRWREIEQFLDNPPGFGRNLRRFATDRLAGAWAARPRLTAGEFFRDPTKRLGQSAGGKLQFGLGFLPLAGLAGADYATGGRFSGSGLGQGVFSGLNLLEAAELARGGGVTGLNTFGRLRAFGAANQFRGGLRGGLGRFAYGTSRLGLPVRAASRAAGAVTLPSLALEAFARTQQGVAYVGNAAGLTGDNTYRSAAGFAGAVGNKNPISQLLSGEARRTAAADDAAFLQMSLQGRADAGTLDSTAWIEEGVAAALAAGGGEWAEWSERHGAATKRMSDALLLDQRLVELGGATLKDLFREGGGPAGPTVAEVRRRIEADLSVLRGLKEQVTRLGAGDTSVLDGQLEAGRAAVEQLARAEGDSASEFFLMLREHDRESYEQVMRSGARLAHRRLFGTENANTSRPWEEAASLLGPDATVADLYGDLVRTNKNATNSGTTRSVDASAVNAAQARARLDQIRGRRGGAGASLTNPIDLERAVRAGVAQREFLEAMQLLGGGLPDAYRQDHAAAMAAVAAFGVPGPGRADPASVDEQLAATLAEAERVAQAVRQAKQYWGEVDDATLGRFAAGITPDGFNPILALGQEPLPHPATLRQAREQLRGQVAEQAAARQSFNRFQEAKARADALAAELQARDRFAGSEGKLRMLEDGRIVNVRRRHGSSEQNRAILARNAAGRDAIGAAAGGVLSGRIRSAGGVYDAIEQVAPDLRRDASALAELDRQLEAVRRDFGGRGQAEQLRARRSQVLLDSEYSVETLNKVQRLAETAEKQAEAARQRQERTGRIAAGGNTGPTPEEVRRFNAAQGTDAGDWEQLPRFRSGSMAQRSGRHVDGSGRIRRDGTLAELHSGEIVLNRQQAESLLRNRFAEGTLPRGHDLVGAAARDYAGGGPEDFGRVRHEGSIELTPSRDLSRALGGLVDLLRQGIPDGVGLQAGQPVPSPLEVY